jgi:hypothetical protein
MYSFYTNFICFQGRFAHRQHHCWWHTGTSHLQVQAIKVLARTSLCGLVCHFMLSGRLLVFYMGMMVCTPPASLLVAYWNLTSSGAGHRGLGLFASSGRGRSESTLGASKRTWDHRRPHSAIGEYIWVSRRGVGSRRAHWAHLEADMGPSETALSCQSGAGEVGGRIEQVGEA